LASADGISLPVFLNDGAERIKLGRLGWLDRIRIGLIDMTACSI
jgi:hypothetical protein